MPLEVSVQSELIVDIRAKKIAGAIRKIISIIQGVAIENRWLTPGGDLLAHFLQEESTIMTDDWYRFLDIRFIPAPKDVPLDGSVPAILLEVTLSSKIAKFAGEGEDRWFLRFQSHIGVDRVVFKARDAEEDFSIPFQHRLVEGTLKGNFNPNTGIVRLDDVEVKKLGYLKHDFQLKGYNVEALVTTLKSGNPDEDPLTLQYDGFNLDVHQTTE